jgi:hypothetical protein
LNSTEGPDTPAQINTVSDIATLLNRGLVAVLEQSRVCLALPTKGATNQWLRQQIRMRALLFFEAHKIILPPHWRAVVQLSPDGGAEMAQAKRELDVVGAARY